MNMNYIGYEEMKERILSTEGFDSIEVTDNTISLYDAKDNRFLNYRNLDTVNLREVFNFNSFDLDKDKFFNIVNLLDKNMFMIVDEIVFINSEKELDVLLEKYDTQYMDIEKAIGINFFNDNVIVINSYLLKKIVHEDCEDDDCLCPKEELSRGIWQTLIHELRHNIVANPIITEDEIAIEEADEDLIEEYCISIYEDIICKYEDRYCFN